MYRIRITLGDKFEELDKQVRAMMKHPGSFSLASPNEAVSVHISSDIKSFAGASKHVSKMLVVEKPEEKTKEDDGILRLLASEALSAISRLHYE